MYTSSWAEVCATAVSASDCEEILGWREWPEAPVASEPAAAETAEAPDVTPEAVDTPEPCHAADGYVFVSYRHADLERIAPTLRMIAGWGVPLWYDRGIPGGAEWNAFIEQRIERCDRVLLFVSPAAVASKYVRREVKFADVVDKRIVSVVAEPTRLAAGLRMLLSAYQMLDASAANFPAALRQALAWTTHSRPDAGPVAQAGPASSGASPTRTLDPLRAANVARSPLRQPR